MNLTPRQIQEIELALNAVAQAHDETLAPIGVSYEYDPTPTAEERLGNTCKHIAEARNRLRQFLASARSAGDAVETGRTLFRDWCGNSYEWDSLPDVIQQRWNRFALRTAKAQQPTT